MPFFDVMGRLFKRIFRKIFGLSRKSSKRKSGFKTIFGKKLIIWVGECSADDQDGDSWAKYKVVEGKVKKRVIDKIRSKSKDNLDYDNYDKLEIVPLSRTAVILYESHKGVGFVPSKKYRVRLFKYYQK